MQLTSLDVVRLFAIAFVSLYLVPVGAHFFELPNKIDLSPDQYMTVQKIYAGWALFGIIMGGSLLFTIAHTVMVRQVPKAFWFSASAVACLVATQVIFWVFTFPMNSASANWTVTPDSFEAARRQWEYSHAASAVLTFAALMSLSLSILVNRHTLAPAHQPR